jgi:hypothetical protein
MPVGDQKAILDLKSRRRGDPWQPVWMYMTTTDPQGHLRRRADMPWHGSNVMVLNENARRIVEPVLGDDVEYLPAYDTDGKNLFLVHPWRLVDALDEERSDVRRFESSGRIMDVRKWIFRAEALGGVRSFRVPQQPHRMLVTDEVVSAIAASGLRGTRFRLVWRSAQPGT